MKDFIIGFGKIIWIVIYTVLCMDLKALTAESAFLWVLMTIINVTLIVRFIIDHWES